MLGVPSTWRSYLKLQNFIWVALFAALAIFSPERSPAVRTLLIALGILQIVNRVSACEPQLS